MNLTGGLMIEPLLYCYVRTSWLTQLSPVPCIVPKICATEALPADLLRKICFAFHFATKNGLKLRSRAGNFALWVEKRRSYTKQEVWPTEDRSAESLLPGSSVATFWTQRHTFLDCSNIKRVQLQFPSSFILKSFKLTPSIWDPAFSICSMPWVKLLHMWFQQLHHMAALLHFWNFPRVHRMHQCIRFCHHNFVFSLYNRNRKIGVLHANSKFGNKRVRSRSNIWLHCRWDVKNGNWSLISFIRRDCIYLG